MTISYPLGSSRGPPPPSPALIHSPATSSTERERWGFTTAPYCRHLHRQQRQGACPLSSSLHTDSNGYKRYSRKSASGVIDPSIHTHTHSKTCFSSYLSIMSSGYTIHVSALFRLGASRGPALGCPVAVFLFPLARRQSGYWAAWSLRQFVKIRGASRRRWQRRAPGTRRFGGCQRRLRADRVGEMMRRRWQTATGKLEANVLVEKKTIRSDRLPFHLGYLLPPTRGHPEALQATCVVDKGSSRKERKIEPRSFWVDTIRARRKKKRICPPWLRCKW